MDSVGLMLCDVGIKASTYCCLSHFTLIMGLGIVGSRQQLFNSQMRGHRGKELREKLQSTIGQYVCRCTVWGTELSKSMDAALGDINVLTCMAPVSFVYRSNKTITG